MLVFAFSLTSKLIYDLKNKTYASGYYLIVSSWIISYHTHFTFFQT